MPTALSLYPETENREECGTLLPELPIEAPNAVLDTDEAFATRCIHEGAELIDRAVIPWRELEHRLDAVQWEPAQVREHALDELPPSVTTRLPI